MAGFAAVDLTSSNGIEWAKHHAVSVAVFGESDFFKAIKPYFDPTSFAANGVPLPASIQGGTATGMSIHIDSHPAYIAWQRQRFADFESKLSAGEFGGLTRDQWLQARAAEVHGFKAYVQTELTKGTLALNWRQINSGQLELPCGPPHIKVRTHDFSVQSTPAARRRDP